MSMEEIHSFKGDRIVTQGDDGDYYYIIKKGQCTVSRKPAEKVDEVRLATLSQGDGFGEESLITHGKRNATVTMLENGTLMRLKKDDFLTLLVKPLIRNVHINSLKSSLYKDSIIIDVRSNDDFKLNHLNDSRHIPLSMMRLRIPTLDHSRQYLIYSNNKDDASAAAFLLAQHGINSSVILGNLEQATTVLQAELPDTTKTKSEPATVIPISTGQPTVPNVAEPVKLEKLTVELEAKTITEESSKITPAPKESTDNTAISQQSISSEDQNKQNEEIEKLRKEAEYQVQKMLSEAESIKESAIKEATLLKQKLQHEESSKLRSELEHTRRKAEDAISRSERLAKEIRQQAEKDSSEIRQQALHDAEKLRFEIEQLRQKEIQMKSQLDSEIFRLKQVAAEEARQLALQEANKARLAAEEAAILAKQTALLEAEETREKAKQEAELARSEALREAEKTLKSAEQAAIKAQEKADQLTDEAKAIEREAEQARIKAAKEAHDIRQAALNEAEAIKQAALLEGQRLKQQHSKKDVSIIKHDNIFDLDEDISPVSEPIMPFADEDSMAMEMANEIREKLLEAEQQRIENENKARSESQQQDVKVRKLTGKTILETATEMFVFKEPKTPQTYVRTFNDHINTGTFELEPVEEKKTVEQLTNKPAVKPKSIKSSLSNTLHVPNFSVDNPPEKPSYKRSLLTVSISIFLVITLSLVAYTTKIQINFTEVDALVNQETIESKEETVKQNARKEFRNKLSIIKP
ncbi:MAG: cyclic nucleotide-binding domain-containing protein [Gammaproteobacteria bacterium]|nr:cyclic nucleotide-binding domain-containing protein [Gammaproteobacteria bacterium]